MKMDVRRHHPQLEDLSSTLDALEAALKPSPTTWQASRPSSLTGQSEVERRDMLRHRIAAFLYVTLETFPR